MNSTNHTTPL